ncbi:putative signal transducing protein [Gimesia aquarii]|uniref:DUF2007 domain-containing protein n=1 Tax=Gimesia aquarii TaxID=2527964 RepID=A0A517VUZ2_9PLAN|nr:DUF2007 domain-containing protein [Gimesia aquarii]QDT96820.1 hypothetical protein V144x_22780 [Gimesia aquarii]
MSDDLVTVATLNTPTEAILVRNLLDAEGIPVFLSDTEAVGMAWYLGYALGGVKVQVAESDVERAFEVLDDHEPVTITEEDWKIVESFEEESEDEKDEWEDDEEEHNLDVLEVESTSEIDAIVNRAYKSAFFGVIFFPLQFYSLALLTKILLGSYDLNSEQQKKMTIGYILCSVMLTFLFLVFFESSP